MKNPYVEALTGPEILSQLQENGERLDGIAAELRLSRTAMVNGFSRLEKRFDALDATFGTLNNRLNTLNSLLSQLSKTLATPASNVGMTTDGAIE